MKRLMLSAMASNSGKTVLTCGLLTALKNRGLEPEAYKCGPDYVDPMFHSRVLGVPCRNLDLFLQGEQGVGRTLAGQRSGIALIEGAMGFYDGLNGTDQASPWQLAALWNIPTVLILRPGGGSLTLAAQLKGLLDFRRPCPIVGVIFTDCKQSLHDYLKPLVERETGLAVLGWLPPMEQARLSSRHLGLVRAEEVTDFQQRFQAVAAQLEQTVDISKLLRLAGEVPQGELTRTPPPPPRCTIAVARDEAFCFHYADGLEELERQGARLVYFSPLHDSAPPAMDGLYLCGGYPELHAGQLAENRSMRQALNGAILSGLPTLAECGGFLYLQRQLESPEGEAYPMLDVLPGRGFPTGGLRRFGYAHLCPQEDSMLFRAGERVPVHEFHHWDCTQPGQALPVEKANGKRWRCGVCTPSLYAGFPHLHLGGQLPLARRFVDRAEQYKRHGGDQNGAG